MGLAANTETVLISLMEMEFVSLTLAEIARREAGQG